MMHSMDLKEKVRAYITSSFIADRNTALGDDEDLLQVLDSLQILRMVVDLESTYGIKVDDGDLAIDNIGSVERIAAFVERKQEGLSPAAGS